MNNPLESQNIKNMLMQINSKATIDDKSILKLQTLLIPIETQLWNVKNVNEALNSNKSVLKGLSEAVVYNSQRSFAWKDLSEEQYFYTILINEVKGLINIILNEALNGNKSLHITESMIDKGFRYLKSLM